MEQDRLQTILLIGASRGLGLALAKEWLSRGFRVIATVRGDRPTPLHELASQYKDHLHIRHLDITDPQAVEALRISLQEAEIDTLFINAGVALGAEDRVEKVSDEDFNRILVTNALSPMRLVNRLGPLVKNDGTIGVMSSSLGSVSLNDWGGWEVYRASKAALNTLMRSYAAAHAQDRRSLALVDPGWVKTDMGGENATLTIEESIPHVVDRLAALHGKPGLRFFNYKGETVPW
jgi:NAD(P)-dependent dehydrogenase (short-subunit alcohol dehydrogenase family)